MRVVTSDNPDTWADLDPLFDQQPLGEDPGTVPAVHQVAIVFSWLEAGVYHQQAYGPIEVSDDDFDGMPSAVRRTERRWTSTHDTTQCQMVNISIHVMEPLL